MNASSRVSRFATKVHWAFSTVWSRAVYCAVRKRRAKGRHRHQVRLLSCRRSDDGDRCASLHVAAANELVNNECIEVFSVKADEHGFLAPHASISFPIEFTAPVAGTFQEDYTLVFDQTTPEVCFPSRDKKPELLLLVAFLCPCSIVGRTRVGGESIDRLQNLHVQPSLSGRARATQSKFDRLARVRGRLAAFTATSSRDHSTYGLHTGQVELSTTGEIDGSSIDRRR